MARHRKVHAAVCIPDFGKGALQLVSLQAADIFPFIFLHLTYLLARLSMQNPSSNSKSDGRGYSNSRLLISSIWCGIKHIRANCLSDCLPTEPASLDAYT